FFYFSGVHLVLHSFPTRRSSDLWLIEVFAAISIIYLAFHIFWAMNYHRLPLHESLGLEADYSTEQLLSVTQMLIEKSNALHGQRSEEHTSELQSRENIVCRLLLE